MPVGVGAPPLTQQLLSIVQIIEKGTTFLYILFNTTLGQLIAATHLTAPSFKGDAMCQGQTGRHAMVMSYPPYFKLGKI